jgi:hypothetical protein
MIVGVMPRQSGSGHGDGTTKPLHKMKNVRSILLLFLALTAAHLRAQDCENSADPRGCGIGKSVSGMVHIFARLKANYDLNNAAREAARQTQAEPHPPNQQDNLVWVRSRLSESDVRYVVAMCSVDRTSGPELYQICLEYQTQMKQLANGVSLPVNAAEIQREHDAKLSDWQKRNPSK